jgi:hypothetical protein
MANPWKADEWNLTEQGRYVARYGVDAGARLAKSVGSSLGALKPMLLQNNKIYVIRGKPGTPGKDAAVKPILGFTAEGPFVALEKFALAPTPEAIRFPSASAALSAATCLFAPVVDSVFTLTDEPDEFLAVGDNVIAQVTFPAGSQIGMFTWGPLITLPASSRLYIIAPASADLVLGGVQIMFRGDAT